MADNGKSRFGAGPIVLGAAVLVALIFVGYVAFAGRGAGGKRGRGFEERAQQAGLDFQMHNLSNEQGEHFKINLYDHGSGLAIGDFDNDGRDDIYFLNQHGPDALYRNKGDGTFEDVTAKAGVAMDGRVSVAATFADYDNDGYEDLFVTTTRGGNVLFHNRGDGTFEDVTSKAGVSHVGHSQTAVFFDYDNDGLLDLFVTNTAHWTTDTLDMVNHNYEGKASLEALMNSPIESNILYHNNGNGTFTDVTDKAGLSGRGWAGDVAVFDYDDDGYLDLFVPSMFGRGQLYHNNRDGTFTDVTMQTLGPTPHGAIGAKVFDYDGDGRLDLYVVDMHSDMWMGLDARHASADTAKQVEHVRFHSPAGPTVNENDPRFVIEQKRAFAMNGQNYSDYLFGNALYRNLGNGKFEEGAVAAGLETFWPWGIATGDFDNDGHEDAFITAGMGYPFYYWPNSLMMNRGNGTFTDEAAQLGVESPTGGTNQPTPIAGKPAARSSRSAAVADFDGDGRLEIVVNNFNDKPYFFANRFPRRNYIEFRLTGTTSNRDAIGALVRLWIGGNQLVRQVDPAGGYLAQSSKVVHFGLGDAQQVDSVVVRWPRGKLQTLVNPKVNSLVKLTEPAG
ncbi:MAG TPA: CRTAC1 family protein [Gemmatimonadaceae bacterium]